MELTLSEILYHFDVKLDDDNEIPYGNGHINRTFVVGKKERYILQKINTSVFRDPGLVMENIRAVTTHLRKKAEERGEDPDRATLTLIPTVNGESYWDAPDGAAYRLYRFIEGTVCYEGVEDPHILYHAARAFGKFQNLLADFPAESLGEVIPNFHNTPDRYAALLRAVAENKVGRVGEVGAEIAFATARAADTARVTDAIQNGLVPLRVTHNDTKLNNVMLDAKTNEGVCVIDLDTVMPGSLLYDFGDALRFAGNAAAEDEKDLSQVVFRLDCFREFVHGYAQELCAVMTPTEIELLPFSVKLMTYECGIRFLTDYLNGDTYFRIHYPTHNLDRCRNQFKLVADMEGKMDEMAAIVKEYL